MSQLWHHHCQEDVVVEMNLVMCTGNVIISNEDVMVVENFENEEDDKNVVDVVKVEDNNVENVNCESINLAQEKFNCITKISLSVCVYIYKISFSVCV
jgi:hypothetical protein